MPAIEIDSLRRAAMTLPENERAKLASDLVASLDGPVDPDAVKAWDVELCRRINEIELGDTELLDVDDMLARARSRIRD